MKTRFEERRTHTNEFSADGVDRFHSLHGGGRTILLITDDKEFHRSLRSFANQAGLMVVNVACSVGTLEVLQAVRPSAVLLDLDLPDETAWKTADILLNEPDCPAVILLSGRTGHLAMQRAILAGLLVSKGDSPDRLLKIIEEALETAGPDQAQRNAFRRELIRWLRPSVWETDSSSLYRFRGINDDKSNPSELGFTPLGPHREMDRE